MTEPDSTTPAPKPSGGYGNRTLRHDFDDLADGLYVEIRNPSMLPIDALSPNRDLSKVKDKHERTRIMNAWLAGFIISWRIYDITDMSNDPAVLGEPCGETLALAPGVVPNWIAKQVTAAADPT